MDALLKDRSASNSQTRPTIDALRKDGGAPSGQTRPPLDALLKDRSTLNGQTRLTMDVLQNDGIAPNGQTQPTTDALLKHGSAPINRAYSLYRVLTATVRLHGVYYSDFRIRTLIHVLIFCSYFRHFMYLFTCI